MIGNQVAALCPDCDGDGWQEHLTEDLKYHSWLCETCGGTGKLSQRNVTDRKPSKTSENATKSQPQERR